MGESVVAEITPEFALELLSHMKGGPSIEVLLDLALGNDVAIAKGAANVLKTQVYLYDADTDRLAASYKDGNEIAKDILSCKIGVMSNEKLYLCEDKLKALGN